MSLHYVLRYDDSIIIKFLKISYLRPITHWIFRLHHYTKLCNFLLLEFFWELVVSRHMAQCVFGPAPFKMNDPWNTFLKIQKKNIYIFIFTKIWKLYVPFELNKPESRPVPVRCCTCCNAIPIIQVIIRRCCAATPIINPKVRIYSIFRQ